MKIKQNVFYLKHFSEHYFNIKHFWLKRLKKRRKKRVFRFNKRARCQHKKIPVINFPPKCVRYWKFPSIYKKSKYNAFWKFLYKHYKRYPWLTALVQKRSLYRHSFIRQTYVYKYPTNKTKNKFYKKEFSEYTNPKHIQFRKKKAMLKKRAIQNRPIVRYYVYSPYLNYIRPKQLLKKTKKLKKTKNSFVENAQIKFIELKTEKFLTRINFASNKNNTLFLKKTGSLAKHNSKMIVLMPKKQIKPVCFEHNNTDFDWKFDCFLNFQLPFLVVKKEKPINKNESFSINKNYFKLNWSFFLSLQKKKYTPHYCNINSSKNIVYINRCFLYRNVLKNERLCKKHWTPITLLKNKIKYYYI